MGTPRVFSREPADVPAVKTEHREIRTKLPVPESLELLNDLETYEPQSMQGQAPMVWDRAVGYNIYDPWGNKWIDWSSGVLITTAGHGRKEIAEAVTAEVNRPLLATYCFPSEARRRLAGKLVEVSPEGIDKAFILTTGSEAVECAIKLSRTKGLQKSPDKKVIVSFNGEFHGRTLASQLAGGIPGLKNWCGDIAADSFVQVPWPGDFRVKDKSFSLFEKTLEDKGFKAADVCCVLVETYQGGSASFMPGEYADSLAAWCRKNDALLIYDEVQAGFGRCGTFWGFEEYNTHVDLICCGKGISSSLPISAVLGRADIMDLYAPRTMTSTHAAAPLGCAAAYANIEIIENEGLVKKAAENGKILLDGLRNIAEAYPENVAAVNGKGMVAAMCMVKPGTEDPDGESAFAIVEKCFQKGLLLFSPVGPEGSTVKICPPAVSPAEAIQEALTVMEEAFREVLG